MHLFILPCVSFRNASCVLCKALRIALLLKDAIRTNLPRLVWLFRSQCDFAVCLECFVKLWLTTINYTTPLQVKWGKYICGCNWLRIDTNMQVSHIPFNHLGTPTDLVCRWNLPRIALRSRWCNWKLNWVSVDLARVKYLKISATG